MTPCSLRLAVIDTNPVQYRVPLWRAIERDGRIALTVYYASRVGLEPANIPGFGESWLWDVPLLDGYRHEFLPSVAVPGLARPTANRFPKGLRSRLRQGHFDAILVLGYANAPALAGMIAGWATRTPVLLRGETHGRGTVMTMRKRVKRWSLPLLLKGASAVLAIGQWNRRYWLDLGVPASKIWTALYSVDDGHFKRRIAEEPERVRALRARWGAGADDVVFLFCGTLTAGKEPKLFIRALAEMGRSASVHGVIVGVGPIESQVKQLAATLQLPHVHWEGFVNQRDLPFHYSAADVLVLPSRSETWGLVVNEALACGTPCIVSDLVGAGPDLVSEPGAGTVFEHDNLASLVAAMRSALSVETRSRWREQTTRALAEASFARNIDVLVDCLTTLRRRPAGVEARDLR